MPSASVFYEDAVAYPRHVVGQLFQRQDAKGGSRFVRRVTRNVEKAGDARATVGDQHNDVSARIDEPGVEHGAVEPSAALG